MRIAQVAPLHESVPPRHYGGTERVVSYLTEELVRRGHQVTLFATQDSITGAELVPYPVGALRRNPAGTDALADHLVHVERAFQQSKRFDVMHFHTEAVHLGLARRTAVPTLTTLHGRLDRPELARLYGEYADVPLVSISVAQRQPLPGAHWMGTVPHGLPPDLYTFHPHPGSYLLFVGRVSPEKRLDRAVEIARAAGMPLKVAAKVDHLDQPHFQHLAPMLQAPGVEFLGEVDQADKDALLGNAAALLFPVDWPEPFGLVMIEALACGTPVIAFPGGAVPEVVRDGVCGFLCTSVPEGVRAVARLPTLRRAACRAWFLERFTVSRMAADYLDIYRRLAAAPGPLAPAG